MGCKSIKSVSVEHHEYHPRMGTRKLLAYQTTDSYPIIQRTHSGIKISYAPAYVGDWVA